RRARRRGDGGGEGQAESACGAAHRVVVAADPSPRKRGSDAGAVREARDATKRAERRSVLMPTATEQARDPRDGPAASPPREQGDRQRDARHEGAEERALRRLPDEVPRPRLHSALPLGLGGEREAPVVLDEELLDDELLAFL